MLFHWWLLCPSAQRRSITGWSCSAVYTNVNGDILSYTSKTAKRKKVILPSSTSPNVNVLLSNVTYMVRTFWQSVGVFCYFWRYFHCDLEHLSHVVPRSGFISPCLNSVKLSVPNVWTQSSSLFLTFLLLIHCVTLWPWLGLRDLARW